MGASTRTAIQNNRENRYLYRAFGAQPRYKPIPREALFLAGKVFLSYRRARGIKHSVLPDFYVGAHTAVMHCPILTRDVARYRTCFPTVQLITP